MIESEIFTGFTLRDLPDNRRVAVLHLIAPDGQASSEESIFDAAGLEARIAALQGWGSDTSISSAALQALRHGRDDASRMVVAADARVAQAPAARPSLLFAPVRLGLPGRSALLRALSDALSPGGRGGEHGPQLAVLTVRGLEAMEAYHGETVVQAALLGVGDRIDDNLRRMDMLAHLGGPCFAACLPRVSRRDAEAIAYRLARAVAATPIETPCGPVVLHLDYGVFGEVRHAEGGVAERAAAMLAAAEGVAALIEV